MSYEDAAPPAPTDSKQEEGWVLIQKKTFTKWCNNHLTKKGFPIIKDAQTDFETGVYLGNIVRALYPDVPAPKFNKDPKLRPHKLDNIALALKMVEDAHIKTNFLKSTHLVDHDLKMILGMMWAIILDYAIKGISVEELTAKEGLLLWCRKKTAGYRDVDPPSIQNFTRDWRNGLAFCALIHRHQPHLIDYDSLDKNNAAENLELAFSVAERELGIPRLLDIEDLTTEKPDERSVMTYVSEYFHRFAGQDLRELAARRCAKFLQFTRTMADLKNDYEEQARALIQWTNDTISNFQSAQFGDTIDDAITVNANLREFVLTIKPQRAAQKLDLESLFAEIQTQLRVNNRPAYEPPHDVAPEAIEEHFNHLWESEKQYGKLARENRFKFIKKTETKLSEEKLQEFRDSFAHFDANNNGWLDKVEFKAALSALSIPFKDDAEFTKVFTQVAEGQPHITQDAYIRYLTALSEDKDTAEQIKQSFAAIADGGKYITAQQLRTPPLTDEDVQFLLKHLPSAGGDVEAYDYSTFVDNNFATHE